MSTPFGPYRSGHHTHEGPRDTNQDTVLSIALSEDRWLLAVADGMGGLEEGELASKTALGTLYKSLLGGADLVPAVQEANRAVEQEAQGRQMGTTLVAAVVSGTRAEIVNVGDSRAYQSDLLGLIQITQDHTMAYEAERDGSLPFGGIDDESGRWGSALARYLGSGGEIQVDRFGPLDLLEGGWLLLCSDGLHGVLSVDDIDSVLVEHSDPGEAAVALVEEALARKTGDNVSVALFHWPDSSPVQRPSVQRRPRSSGSRGEKILISTRKNRSSRKVLRLAFRTFLILIPLAAALYFLRDWALSL